MGAADQTSELNDKFAERLLVESFNSQRHCETLCLSLINASIAVAGLMFTIAAFTVRDVAQVGFVRVLDIVGIPLVGLGSLLLAASNSFRDKWEHYGAVRRGLLGSDGSRWFPQVDFDGRDPRGDKRFLGIFPHAGPTSVFSTARGASVTLILVGAYPLVAHAVSLLKS